MDIFELDRTYVANTYKRFPVELVRGRGSELFDAKGKRYIDLGSGIAVNIFGACDEVWANAVTRQLTKLQHTSNLYYTDPCAILAQKLCSSTGMKKVFFGNSGAEANEGAIKAARRYSVKKYGEGRRIFKMSPIHHHFELCKWSEYKIVAVFSLTGLAAGVIAVLLQL